MNHAPIYLTRTDHAKLRLLANSLPASPRHEAVARLRAELDRAVLLDDQADLRGLVVMNAQVEFEDLRTGEVESYVLSYPERADAPAGRLSVLAPVGTALLGCRAGDTVTWPTPGGERRLLIRRVTAPVPPASEPRPLVHHA